MTKSYSATSELSRDRVRELIADADGARFVLENETIDRLLSENDNSIPRAAALAARLIYNTMLRAPDRSIADISVTRARADTYLALVNDLEAAQSDVHTMYMGGTSRAADDAIRANTDWSPHAFGTGAFDRYGGGGGCCGGDPGCCP